MKPPESVVILLAELDGDPANVRSVVAADEGMAKSLEFGQLQPILVYRKGSRFVVLDGHRRVAARRLAGHDSVHAIVVAAPSKPGERILLQLIANLQREDVSPMDRARGFRGYMSEAGCTASELAERSGLSEATVSRTLALLDLPESTQRQIASGEMTASDGYRMARKGERRVSASVRAADDSASGESARTERQKAGRTTAMLGSGRQVAFAARCPLTLDLVIEMIEELLGKARRFRNRGATLETLVAQLKLDAKSGRSAGEAQS